MALRENAIDRINLFAKQENEVISKRNTMLNSGTKPEDIFGLDYPQRMLILELDNSVFNKHEFIAALKIFISGDIRDEELSMGKEKGWRYGKFYCPVNGNKIYCDANTLDDIPTNFKNFRAECNVLDGYFYLFSFCPETKNIVNLTLNEDYDGKAMSEIFQYQNPEYLSAEEIEDIAFQNISC